MRRFAKRLGQANNRTCQNTRHRQWQDVVENRLHLRCTHTKSCRPGIIKPAFAIFSNCLSSDKPNCVRLEIFDENWNALPHDGEAVGELCIRGPWIASEYFNDPQPEKFHDGWLVTGDVAKIDDQQYLIIADRSKDLIKSGGEWISSVDLENHIVGLGNIAQAAVVAQPHPKWDERPLLVVVPTANSQSLTKGDVLGYLKGKIAKWWMPDDVAFAKDLPHTATGKLSKLQLRQRFKDYKLPTA